MGIEKPSDYFVEPRRSHFKLFGPYRFPHLITIIGIPYGIIFLRN
jgi:hypothetical protein